MMVVCERETVDNNEVDHEGGGYIGTGGSGAQQTVLRAMSNDGAGREVQRGLTDAVERCR